MRAAISRANWITRRTTIAKRKPQKPAHVCGSADTVVDPPAKDERYRREQNPGRCPSPHGKADSARDAPPHGLGELARDEGEVEHLHKGGLRPRRRKQTKESRTEGICRRLEETRRKARRRSPACWEFKLEFFLARS